MLKLQSLPHHEACGLLARGVPVYLTVNPVEYHGPHLSLHNDRLVSVGLCRDIHRLLQRPDWPFVVASDLEIGVGPTPGPGTRGVSYAGAVGTVQSACQALLDMGAKRVVMMTFHGDPIHNDAIDRGVRLLRDQGVAALAPFNLLMDDMLHFEERFAVNTLPLSKAFEHIDDIFERAELKRRLPFDLHAGFFETSMALHYAPESVSPIYKTLPPCPRIEPHWAWRAAGMLARTFSRVIEKKGRRAETLARELEFTAQAYGWHRLRPFPGYTGQPHLASKTSGAIFASVITERMADEVSQVFADEKVPVGPVLSWAVPMSFGGRFAQLPRMKDELLSPAASIERVRQAQRGERRVRTKV